MAPKKKLTDKAKTKLNRKLNQKIEQEKAELEEQQANLDAEKALLKIAEKNGNENEIAQHERRITKFETFIENITNRMKVLEESLEE